ncbi:LuxR C-terminal-related transcriptional regulator (plasmid) [Rhodococcus opacus]|uniref:helix-turn-helix transcriptional regulator n=1 Tax=Rhodococcus opacus TaxID=37919 RepID=UPI0034D3224A
MRTAAGTRARASGRVRGHLSSLEGALSLLQRLCLPLEAGRTRLALAELLSGDDAVAEARAALAAFDTLGAARDADAAAARSRPAAAPGASVRSPGVSGRCWTCSPRGYPTRELAERFFLYRKTVERHVRNVLFKLGLRNRAEAAAYVVRHGAQMRSTK